MIFHGLLNNKAEERLAEAFAARHYSFRPTDFRNHQRDFTIYLSKLYNVICYDK